MNHGQLNNVSDHRKGEFKKTIDASEGRRRRTDTALRIRKEKKEQQLKKRRDDTFSTQMNANFTDATNQLPDCAGKTDKPTIADAPRLMAMLMSPVATEETLLKATRGFRRILAVEKNIPARELITMGILPHLVRNLTVGSETSSISLIFESAWALTNIASTECAVDVVQAGTIKPLIHLLDHVDKNVREQSVWCLGNIAGEGPAFRDLILQEQPINPLLRNLADVSQRMSHLENVVWTISHLCRGTPSPPTHVTAPVVSPLVALLDEPISDEVREHCLWALSYLSDGDEQKLELVVASGVAPKLVHLLQDDNFKGKCTIPVVRILGNFVLGNDRQTQFAIDSGILNHLPRLLGSRRKVIRKEASRFASNVACGKHAQITTLVNRKRVLRQIIKNATNDVWEVRKEALRAVANICMSGYHTHVMSLVDAGGLEPLITVLKFGNIDPTLLLVILEALGKVLEVGGNLASQNYVDVIEKYNGIDYLEELQTHPSEAVYNKVVELIENYLGTEDGDENLAPETNESGTFNFGFAPKQLFPNINATEQSSSDNALPFGSISANTFDAPTSTLYPV